MADQRTSDRPRLQPDTYEYPRAVRWLIAVVVILGGGLALLGAAMTLSAGPGSLPAPFAGATVGQLVVVALRLLVPLLILRWALAGGLLAMLVDAADVVIVELFGPGGMGAHYSQIDKGLDTFYLSLEAVVAWHWVNPWARSTALVLFAYRLLGTLLFELSEARLLLFLFPNLFENWWLYCLIVARWWPRLLPTSWASTLTPLVILLIPKLAQEYLLHVTEAQPWDWTKEHLLPRG